MMLPQYAGLGEHVFQSCQWMTRHIVLLLGIKKGDGG